MYSLYKKINVSKQSSLFSVNAIFTWICFGSRLQFYQGKKSSITLEFHTEWVFSFSKSRYICCSWTVCKQPNEGFCACRLHVYFCALCTWECTLPSIHWPRLLRKKKKKKGDAQLYPRTQIFKSQLNKMLCVYKPTMWITSESINML